MRNMFFAVNKYYAPLFFKGNSKGRKTPKQRIDPHVNQKITFKFNFVIYFRVSLCLHFLNEDWGKMLDINRSFIGQSFSPKLNKFGLDKQRILHVSWRLKKNTYSRGQHLLGVSLMKMKFVFLGGKRPCNVLLCRGFGWLAGISTISQSFDNS